MTTHVYPTEPAEHPDLACRTCGVTVLLVDVVDPPATNVCFGANGPHACVTRVMRVTAMAKRVAG